MCCYYPLNLTVYSIQLISAHTLTTQLLVLEVTGVYIYSNISLVAHINFHRYSWGITNSKESYRQEVWAVWQIMQM